MPSAYLDGRFPLNRSIRKLSDAAFRLYVTTICQSAASGTPAVGPQGLFKLDDGTRREKITDFLRREVYARDGYACLRCGATDDLTLDHVYPWSRGGPDTFDNLQTLCRPCNSSKGARV